MASLTSGTFTGTSVGATSVTATYFTGSTFSGGTFYGLGTGLSGTASALSIGGSAASATNATYAGSAASATNAGAATNATYAGTAGYCSGNTAGSAASATNASAATNATYATTANTLYAGVDYWHNSRDGYNRFYFGNATHTYIKSPNGIYLRSGNNDTDRGLFDSSAYLYIVGDITAFWSDRRLKKDFEPVTDYENIINGLTAYRFKWNEVGEKMTSGTVKDNEEDIGLIAQDVQAVLPKACAVNLAGKNSEKPAEEQPDYYTIRYNKLTPVVIEALKHTMKKVKVLEDEVKNLKKILGIEQDGDPST